LVLRVKRLLRLLWLHWPGQRCRQRKCCLLRRAELPLQLRCSSCALPTSLALRLLLLLHPRPRRLCRQPLLIPLREHRQRRWWWLKQAWLERAAALLLLLLPSRSLLRV
jgi:hypothetical protein